MNRSVTLFLVTMLLSVIAARAQPLLDDGFNDDTVDPTIWTIFLPYTSAPRSSVTESNGNVLLVRRGVLEANAALPASFDLEGKFRFTGEDDALSVVFRSDLSLTNQFERRGVQVALQEASAKFFLIRDPFSTSAPPVQGSFTIQKNQDVRFRIVDHEDIIRVYLDGYFQPLMTLAVTNRRGDRLALYNGASPGARTAIDELSVHPVLTTVFLDERLVREGPVRRTNAPLVRFQSFFTNAAIFYTLDGSEPSFVSSEYTGAFRPAASGTLRAIAYAADFSQALFSPAIELEITPDVSLTNLTRGGGVLQTEPGGLVFPSNSVITVTALPAPGWEFIRWEGAAEGAENPTTLVMTNHLGLRAVFGAAPAFTVVGNGFAATTPEGPKLEYGDRVRLTAYPSDGSYFVRWGNAVAGTNNPVSFVFTNASTGITVLFATLPADQVSLVTAIDGDGRVASAPGGNTFTLGQTISLLAVPDTDRVFLGWGGGVESRTNPVSLLMDGSKVVTARFGDAVRFLTASNRWAPEGFIVGISALAGATYELQASSNFVDWIRVGPIQSDDGKITFTHEGAAEAPTLFYRVVGP